MTVRGILSKGERHFLNNPPNRILNSNERHYISSIRAKTRKALKDIDLILETMPYGRDLLFEAMDLYSLNENAIGEIAIRLFSRNYREEFWRMRKEDKISGKPDKKLLIEKTRNQLYHFINSVLNEMQTNPEI